MKGVNKVILLGNLTRDPEIRQTAKGLAITTFGLATNRTWIANGEKQDRVEYHNILALGKQAEVCSKFLKKGSGVYLEGRLQNSEWTTSTGERRVRTEVVVTDIVFLSKGRGREDEEFTSEASEDAAFGGAKDLEAGNSKSLDGLGAEQGNPGDGLDSSDEDVDLNELLADTNFDIEEK